MKKIVISKLLLSLTILPSLAFAQYSHTYPTKETKNGGSVTTVNYGAGANNNYGESENTQIYTANGASIHRDGVNSGTTSDQITQDENITTKNGKTIEVKKDFTKTSNGVENTENVTIDGKTKSTTKDFTKTSNGGVEETNTDTTSGKTIQKQYK